MDKFKNKYRIQSARASWWDYASFAPYFITICSKNRKHYFGEIQNGNMILSDIGKIVENEWINTFRLRPDMNLGQGEFIVMPNHFHAIIIIGENKYNIPSYISKKSEKTSINVFGPQSKNLAAIVRGFKSTVTAHARKIHAEFSWQERFHEHIIKNQDSFIKISHYISTNPLRWDEDCYRTIQEI